MPQDDLDKSSMPSTTYGRSRKFVAKVGRHHFAHLRAIADGIDASKSAKLYLGVEHGHEAITAHRQTIDAVRAIARKHGKRDSAWRLIGLTIRPKNEHGKDSTAPNQPKGLTGTRGEEEKRPTIEEFIELKNLHDWSLDEICAQYEDLYPKSDAAPSAKEKLLETAIIRRDKLRQRQLQMLQEMESLCVEMPAPEDLLTGWFDDLTARKLIGAGMINLGQLHDAVCQGGRWFNALPGIGAKKAERIRAFLFQLIPPSARTLPVFSVKVPEPDRSNNFAIGVSNVEQSAVDSGAKHKLLSAKNDLEAIESWIGSRSGDNPLTGKSYMREAQRFLLWLQSDKNCPSFGRVTIEHCLDYKAFLQRIPERYISRKREAPLTPGWAPFRGQLDHNSQKQALVILASMFKWFYEFQYVDGNPWPAVNKKIGDDETRKVKQSKAISELGFAEILGYMERQISSPSRERAVFIFTFMAAVGLRSSELLDVRFKDFILQEDGWVLAIHGKGSKNREAFIPQEGFDALQLFLKSRGFDGIEMAPADFPLISHFKKVDEPLGYQSFYQHVRSWTLKSIQEADLPAKECDRLLLASPHWLRHTFGTNAVARGVGLDVIQAQMGHASIQTSANLYSRAPMKRRASQLSMAFGGEVLRRTSGTSDGDSFDRL